MEIKVYSIRYSKSAIKTDIPRLPKSLHPILQKAIQERLSRDPIGFGKPLQYSLKGYSRLRVSDYRVIYAVLSEKLEVFIVAIRHRKDIYENITWH